MPGNVSSQYITGLLFALPLLEGDSEIHITTPLQSEDYVKITMDVLKALSISIKYKNNCFYIPGKQVYTINGELRVEGDWSNAAFFMTAAAIGGSRIVYTNLKEDSLQGDKAVVDVLKNMGTDIKKDGCTYTLTGTSLVATDIDAMPIPDLVPVLALAASVAKGKSTIFNAERLRIKESDRLKTVFEVLHTLGADIEEKEKMSVVTQTLAKIKEHVSEEDYAKFEEKGKACKFEEVTSWRNEVLANVTEVLMSAEKKENHLRMSVVTENKETSLWNRL